MLRSGLESTHRAGANGAGPSSITSPLGAHSKQKAKQQAQFLVTDTQLWNSIWGFKLHLKVRGKHTVRVSESVASLQVTLKCRFRTGMLRSHHMPCSVALAHLYRASGIRNQLLDSLVALESLPSETLFLTREKAMEA